MFGKFWDFCPLGIAFCPLDAPQKSGAATGSSLQFTTTHEKKFRQSIMVLNCSREDRNAKFVAIQISDDFLYRM